MSTQQPLNNLAQMTGMSPAELQRRAEQMVDVKTGTIQALKTLDAALVATDTASAKSTAEAFAALSTASAQAHGIDDPAQVFTAGVAAQAGYAPEGAAAPTIGGPVAALEKAAKVGSNKVSAFVTGLSKQAKGTSDATTAPDGSDVQAPGTNEQAQVQAELDSTSRAMQFEHIKNEIQKMSQVYTAVSNTLTAMHEQGMTAIRNAKAS